MTTTVSPQMARIDARLADLEPGSLRHRALLALRQFRAGWVELGRLLTQVAFDGDFKDWGYDDFEIYCARELGLKKPTVQKLMISYQYMKTHEAQRLHAFEDDPEHAAPLPDYQTVDLLAQARKKADAGDVADADVSELHARAFAEPGGQGEVRDAIRSRLRPLPAVDAGLKRLQIAARRLRLDLAGAGGNEVPDALRERLEAALLELEELT